MAAATTLVLVGLALVLLRRSAVRVERAVEVTGRVGTDGWTARSSELRAASAELRDAVAARDPR
jgi:hypothetical protein